MIKTALISLVCVSFFFLFTLAVAQETAPQGPSPSPVEYALPYPGILPDHPLFFIKSLRDTILANLISDPVRRVEFHQLLADKYLNMGNYLVDKRNTRLAVATIEKGIQYTKEANRHLGNLPNDNSDQFANTKDRYVKSLVKYQEVISSLLDRFSGSERERTQHVLTQLQELQKKVASR